MSSGPSQGPPPGGTAGSNRPPQAQPRQSPAPPLTPPAPATQSRPSSSHRASKQSSSGSLNPKAMNSAKSFESARSSKRTSSDSLSAGRRIKTPEIAPLPNPKEELLKLLQGQFASLQKILECKICFNLMYEPYTTTCGHTYCYGCFCKSFQQNQPNQVPTCPECRGKLNSPPAPAYTVREMTNVFIANHELLPPGDTLEQHKEWQKEQSDIIQKDKDNRDPQKGGLWQGFFKPRRPRHFPIRDSEDGVDRCPICTWELEDGMCQRCGLPFDDNGGGDWEFSDMASDHPSLMSASVYSGHDLVIEEDYDGEDSFIDDEEEGDWADYDPMDYGDDVAYDQPFTIQRMLNGGPPRPRGNPRLASHSAAGSRSQYSASVVGSEMDTLEEEDEDEDADSSMSGFIAGEEAALDSNRESTATSYNTRSSAYPESIAEEEEEDNDLPVAPAARRWMGSTISSTPTITASQVNRRRRVVSETPSTESGTSASAAAIAEEAEDDDEGPIAPATRRRPRPLSQEEQEPARRVRPRPRGSSAESSSQLGYRPLGANTPQIEEDEDEMSDDDDDDARTEVGWEPINPATERSRNTASLTPRADRPSTPPRSATRSSSIQLGTRGLRRRSSVASVQHYEDNDADGESDTQQNPIQPALQSRSSRTRLRTAPAQQTASTALPRQQITSSEDTDSNDTETSPQNARQARPNRRDPQYDPFLALQFAQHQTEIQTNVVPEGHVFAEFAHLRNANRTPLARPRTVNRNNRSNTATPNAQVIGPSPVARAGQAMYSPARNRISAELMQTMNNTNGVGRTMYGSPRNSISGPSGAGSRLQSITSSTLVPQHSGNRMANTNHLGVSVDPRLQVHQNATAMRQMQNTMTQGYATAPLQATRQNNAMNGPQSPRFPQVVDVMDRPASRVSYRNGQAAQYAPQPTNRPGSNTNRPPSTGSRRGSIPRSPFAAPPQIPSAGVGLNPARTWHPTNPFYNPVRRVPSQRLRNQGSNHTLRPQGSIRVMRQSPQLVEADFDQTSPQMRPSASRMHLRPQASSRRIHVNRGDPGLVQYQQAIQAPAQAVQTRYSPGSSAGTLSEDERIRRATELVQRRMQELSQQPRASAAATARLNSAAVQQRIQERIEANMGRSTQQSSMQARPVVSIPPSRLASSGPQPQPISSRAAAPPITSMQSAPSAINRPATARLVATNLPTAGPQATNAQSPTLNRVQAAAPPIQRTVNQESSRESVQPQVMTPTQSTMRPQPEVASSRAQAPSMANRVTAITTGGDVRRN